MTTYTISWFQKTKDGTSWFRRSYSYESTTEKDAIKEGKRLFNELAYLCVVADGSIQLEHGEPATAFDEFMVKEDKKRKNTTAWKPRKVGR